MCLDFFLIHSALEEQFLINPLLIIHW